MPIAYPIKIQSGNYTYNAIGQLVSDNYGSDGTGHRFTYNVYSMVTEVKNTSGATIAQYVYNDGGFRIKKVVGSTTTWYTRDASGNILASYTTNASNVTKLDEMPIYGASRIGLARTSNGAISSYQYELTDHLGNVRATLSHNTLGDGIETLTGTDYYPGGMELPGRIVGTDYRFGYQGQFAEKDEETGYNQFEARLYDNRIGRWLTTDTAGQYWSPYVGMGNNWPNGVDPDGRINLDWYRNANGKLVYVNDDSFGPNDADRLGEGWEWVGGDEMFGSDILELVRAECWDLNYANLNVNGFLVKDGDGFADRLGFKLMPLSFWESQSGNNNGFPIIADGKGKTSTIIKTQVWTDYTYVKKDNITAYVKTEWKSTKGGVFYYEDVFHYDVKFITPHSLIDGFRIAEKGWKIYDLSIFDLIDHGTTRFIEWDNTPTGTLLENYRGQK